MHTPLPATLADEEHITCTIEDHLIQEAIENLLRGEKTELDSYIISFEKRDKIHNTRVSAHCHMVQCGQNGARIKDLAKALAERIVDYAIPRSEFSEAKLYDAKFNTDAKTARLREKARSLFTNLKKTGEGGEMLLYMLIQTVLGLPQLLCKMPLKTNNKLHYNGVDGVHVQIDPKDNHLILYWGESKLYKSLTTALRNCIKSLKPYLLDDGGTGSPLERDLFLIRDNLDLDNEQLESAILALLDKDNPNIINLEYRGVILVGFDSMAYPTGSNIKTNSQICSELKKEVDAWIKNLSNLLSEEERLQKFGLTVFFLPFPSVAAFRKSFIKEIGI